MRRDIIIPTITATASLISGFCYGESSKKPNLLIIQTDEQSFRTLGCYRDMLSGSQANIWGSNANVETPNIDRLASQGVICSNYYAASPVSTPSRASFQTGMYPIATGAPINGMTMKSDLATFAQMLQQDGYQTNYIGKWHLAGTAHTQKLFVNPGAGCGYSDRSYLFETNHAKWYKIVGKPTDVIASNRLPQPVDPAMYSTDFLTERCLEMLERDKNKPFCMMLSIPDPHSPNIGREPYKSMFSSMKIEKPKTMADNLVAARPKWAVGGKNESLDFDPKQVREYFAMVKCIDDNVGRILDFLDNNNLAQNTIVVFTSDHGDMMYEHHKMDKGNPYEGAAKIPFIMRYPDKIMAGKVIEKCYTTNDFAPTILSLMGCSNKLENIHGADDSKTFLSRDKRVKSDRIVYLTDSPFNVWTAAVDGRYKLVLSCRDTPWLFDLKRDPNEVVNYYSDPKYKKVAQKLQKELLRQMKLYKEPALELGLNYLLYADAKVTYVSPYEGLNRKEIIKAERTVLSDAIKAIETIIYKKK